MMNENKKNIIKRIDHFVITTEKPAECLSFYESLGFCAKQEGGRFALFADDFKINVHIRHHELEPKALHVQTGSADFCFEVNEPVEELEKKLILCGIIPISDVVSRNGRHGAMHSIYLRDPDGNLVELCNYR